MVPKTSSQDQFMKDMTAVLNLSDYKALMIHTAMKNIICHSITEQRLQGQRDEYRINLSPLGFVTLYKDDNDNWNLKDFEIDNAFQKTLNQSIKSGESLLYQQNKDWITTLVQNQVNTLSEDY